MEETPDISHTSRSHRPADGNGLTIGDIRVTSFALVCTRMRELYQVLSKLWTTSNLRFSRGMIHSANIDQNLNPCIGMPF
jgi:hypothetical protein